MIATYKRKEVWKIFGYWFFWISILFFTIYPLCNWFTSHRENLYHIYFESELAIPFVPQFVLIYMSLYLTFILPPFFLHERQLVKLGKELVIGTIISGVIFLIFPSVLGFERVIPQGEYQEYFKNIFMLDFPHNMVPSLHIVYSGFILLSVYQAVSSTWIKTFVSIWFLLICASTLLVHQHHIADVLLGSIIVLLFNYYIEEKKND